MTRLPPLNALRVFSVAARHQSFTQAAEELGVTQSAVSKQVANLEDHLGCVLFERKNRSLTLTTEGHLCAAATSQSFEALQQRLAVIGSRETRTLSILTDTDFAQLWLFPRLPKFERANPDIKISLRTRNDPKPIQQNEVQEFAISWGRASWDSLLFEPLLTNTSFLVCAPDFFSGKTPRPELILQEHLIHDRNTYWWTAFLNDLNIAGVDPCDGRIYGQTILCLEAAARGDGITTGDEVSTRGFLEAGRLIIPFPNCLPCPDSYYMLAPRFEKFDREPWRLFRNWLTEEANEHRLWFSDYWRSQIG